MITFSDGLRRSASSTSWRPFMPGRPRSVSRMSMRRILLQDGQRLGAIGRLGGGKTDLLHHVHRGHADQRDILHHQHLAAPFATAMSGAEAGGAMAPRAVPANTLRSLRASSSLR